MKDAIKEIEAQATVPANQIPVAVPTVINLGRVKKALVKKLKNGHGKLMEDLVQIAHSEIAKLPEPSKGKTYQPVIIVYRRSNKRSKRKMSVLGATIDRKKLRRSGISL